MSLPCLLVIKHLAPVDVSLDKLMELMVIKKCHMILLALILSIEYDWANGASGTRDRHPNLANSPSLPPYKDVIGPSTPVAGVAPPPPYCVYPPPAKPMLPALLPPTPVSPGAAPPAGPPSIAPGSSPPTINVPPAFLPPVAFPTPPAQPGVWCVANPTVASAVVQPAMDYACGSGAACDMTVPGGPCYLPDTLMAHASYAFNSYWQRTKVAGGTCDFAGAAMLITKDPSYDGCRYVYM